MSNNLNLITNPEQFANAISKLLSYRVGYALNILDDNDSSAVYHDLKMQIQEIRGIITCLQALELVYSTNQEMLKCLIECHDFVHSIDQELTEISKVYFNRIHQ